MELWTLPFSDNRNDTAIWPVQVVWGLMPFSFKEVPLKERAFLPMAY